MSVDRCTRRPGTSRPIATERRPRSEKCRQNAGQPAGSLERPGSIRENAGMTSDGSAGVRAALDRAIASGRPVTIVCRLESGDTHEVGGVVTAWFKGHDGRDRVGLLVGQQTQQALLFDTMESVREEE